MHHVLHKTINQEQLFSTFIRNFSQAPNQQISMISEGLCDIVSHNASALTPDFAQHGNTRAVSQHMGNKVNGVTYLKK